MARGVRTRPLTGVDLPSARIRGGLGRGRAMSPSAQAGSDGGRGRTVTPCGRTSGDGGRGRR